MDIVSFETAKKLKEAGFPQPTPAPGQFWHEGNEGGLFVIGRVYGDKMTGCYIESERTPQHLVFERATMNGKEIFAPTATDILRLLPDQDFYFDGKQFVFSGDMEQGGENPAEVAAKKGLQ